MPLENRLQSGGDGQEPAVAAIGPINLDTERQMSGTRDCRKTDGRNARIARWVGVAYVSGEGRHAGAV